MKHFPASRFPTRLEGLSVAHAPRGITLSRGWAVVVGLALFTAGWEVALWTIGLICTAR